MLHLRRGAVKRRVARSARADQIQRPHVDPRLAGEIDAVVRVGDEHQPAVGIADPRVHLLVDAKLRPTRNLVIGLKRSRFESEEQVADAMQRLFWYMPPLRSLMLMPEDWSEADMTRLTDISG